MTHVVTSACIDHKYQDCVAVCPVDAFRELDNYLVIDPDDCIDCGACIPECPVEAIFADTDLPNEHEEWLDRNETESINAPLATGDSPVLA
ncbi:MAG: indolepyruvate ferredoxin oxidoreductase subunit alpha [Promethearchaeota archaeon]|mgnify:CR=1 FL=1|jgi:ferredoxin|tara:strand:- start:251 stop:523 length:273 start_codon:yes stop_codon:yes gene_type:complete